MQNEEQIDRIILALLFASDEPLPPKKISLALGDESGANVKDSLERLKNKLQSDRSSIMLEFVAGGYQLATRPEYAEYVARLYTGKRKHRLSRAGLETLAIIAYKQPITRAEVEHIRGVSCGGVISTLMERSLIKIEGKAKVLGAPFLYGTSRDFLEYLGLSSLRDLPSMEELESILESKEIMDNNSDATSSNPDDSESSLDSLSVPPDPGSSTVSDVSIDEDKQR